MAYNGWTNYETWATNLHFDDYFTEDAEQYRDDVDGFATYIEETVGEAVGVDNMTGLASDLLNAALSEVNWVEIATGYLDELEEEEEEEEEE